MRYFYTYQERKHIRKSVLIDAYERLQACHVELDVEEAVAGACLIPEDVVCIMLNKDLDEDCFWDENCRNIFLAAKECLISDGRVSVDLVAEKLNQPVEDIRRLVHPCANERMEFYIKILVAYKIRRAIIRESYHLLEKASDDNYHIDDLFILCAQLQHSVLSGKASQITPMYNGID